MPPRFRAAAMRSNLPQNARAEAGGSVENLATASVRSRCQVR